MRYEEVNKEIREIRDNCPITASSVTGTGGGSVCRCCEAVEANHCSYFTSSVQCPPQIPPPPSKITQCCAMRVMIRNLQRYLANGGSGNQKVCC